MNKKIIVSALALAMGATLAGSISGTVAWYQYSTRAQAAYIGTSIGASENLEIKVGSSTWMDELNSTVVGNNITSGYDAAGVEPITTGDQLTGAAALPDSDEFYLNPTKGVGGYGTGKWEPAECKSKMVQFELYFRYKHSEDVDSYLGKTLKLIDLTFVDLSGQDLYKALRVHLAVHTATPSYQLLARDMLENTSEAANIATVMGGKLDMGNKGYYDQTEGYEWDSRTDVVYGDEEVTQTATNVAKSGVLSSGISLGTLPTTEAGLNITVTIWIEGWQKLSNIPANNADTGSSAIWNPNTYVNKTFKVGMRFGAF